MRALILENSRLYRQLLDNILGQQGFENDITEEMYVAKDFLAENSYDIICLNETLKDGSGVELVKYCKQNLSLKNIPILFFTSDNRTAKQLDQLDIDEIIFKRNLQQISDQITRFLETKLDPVYANGRILFVEDSLSISKLILSALGQDGYRVEHFDAADKAWSEFIEEVSYGSDLDAYDLIITDINVAGDINGQELTHLVRNLGDARSFIPIIAITSQTDAELRLSLFQEGITDFILKPILVDELLVRVKNLITNKKLLDKVHDQRRELFAMAHTDKLTGCHNRHSLMEFSTKLLSQAIRQEFNVSMMVLDLDYFKKINDNYGHAVGDIVLSEVGKLLNASFREGDMVARFGGEEFIVLLHHCDRDSALSKAEKLKKDIVKLKPNQLPISASIGVTTLEIGMQYDFERLFSAADQGVYQAKENGRNQVQFYQTGTI